MSDATSRTSAKRAAQSQDDARFNVPVTLTTGEAKMISAAFPYKKQRRQVLGSEMAYVEVGQGDMVAADDAKDAATVQKAGFVDLGVIKGNMGDQNYTLGSDLDPAKYRSVSIWCKRFSVNFGAAALRATEASQNH
jgi:hypothetical protein